MIEGARAYLKQFAGIDRYYAQLLSKASQKDLSFNDQYGDSAGVILSSHKVRGAFTRSGFLLVQDFLKNPSLYMGGRLGVGEGRRQSRRSGRHPPETD